MFKKCPNHQEINQLVDLFKPILNTIEFEETDSERCISVSYIAKTKDDWSISAIFETDNVKKKDNKYYYPTIEFEKNRVQNRFDFKGVEVPATTEEELANKNKADEIMDHFQKIYNPNFERAIEIIKLYLQEGMNAGIYNHVKLMKHDKTVKKQFYRYENCYNGYNRLFFNQAVLAKITFNNILQTLRYNETKFKKSHLTLDFLYLISKDNKINPYFKIKLPYSSHKKTHCILSMDCTKMYFVNADSQLKEDYIDNLEEHQTNDDYLKSLFQKNFRKEVVSSISKTLKIKKKDLDQMSDEELKGHFILVEMAKF